MKLLKKIRQYLFLLPILFTLSLFLYSRWEARNDRLEFRILKADDILELPKEVKSIDILFDKKSIIDERITHYQIEIRKVGLKSIDNSNYDTTSVFGIEIKNGIILQKPTLEETSNEGYIGKKVKSKLSENKKFIRFPWLFFENQDYFTLEFYVLHNKNESPKLNSRGKISGVKMFVIENNMLNAPKSVIKNIFDGSMLINLLRALIYYLLFYSSILLCKKIYDFFTTKKKKQKGENIELRRENIKNKYLKDIDYLDNDRVNALLDIYVKHDENALHFLYDIFNESNFEELISAAKYPEKPNITFSSFLDDSGLSEDARKEVFKVLSARVLINKDPSNFQTDALFLKERTKKIIDFIQNNS